MNTETITATPATAARMAARDAVDAVQAANDKAAKAYSRALTKARRTRTEADVAKAVAARLAWDAARADEVAARQALRAC